MNACFKMLAATLLSLAFVSAAALAGEDAGDQQIRDALRAMRMHLAQQNAFAPSASAQAARDITLPESRGFDLGLLVDSTDAGHAADGLHVLAVTPDSLGARLGVRAGDVVRSINRTSLAGLGADARGRPAAMQVLRRALDALPDGAAIELGVQRHGESRQLTARMRRIALPAMRLRLGGAGKPVVQGAANSTRPAGSAASPCGRVVYLPPPSRGLTLFPVRLLEVDARARSAREQPSLRLKAGVHRLRLAAVIPSRMLTSPLQLERLRQAQNLDLDVQDNHSYQLAARLGEDARGHPQWEPVVWNTVKEVCK